TTGIAPAGGPGSIRRAAIILCFQIRKPQWTTSLRNTNFRKSNYGCGPRHRGCRDGKETRGIEPSPLRFKQIAQCALSLIGGALYGAAARHFATATTANDAGGAEKTNSEL